MKLSERNTDGHALVLREIEDRDLPTLTRYWTDASDDHLELLGVDREALGSRDEIEARFQSYLDAPTESGKVLWVTTRDDTVVAYVNFHLCSPDENYMHGHIIAENLRGQGLGFDGTLNVLRQAFTRFEGINSIMLVTQPTNDRVNGLLTKLGLRSERRYFEKPDGLPQPGWFFVFEISRRMTEATTKTDRSLSTIQPVA